VSLTRHLVCGKIIAKLLVHRKIRLEIVRNELRSSGFKWPFGSDALQTMVVTGARMSLYDFNDDRKLLLQSDYTLVAKCIAWRSERWAELTLGRRHGERNAVIDSMLEWSAVL